MTVSYKLKNAVNIGTAPVAVYTVPINTTALVHSLIIANRSGVDATVDVQVTDVTAGITSYILRQAPLPANGAVIPFGDNNKQALEASDIITITASAVSTADATLGIMEEST